MRPFGCHVTILNTLDYLGKFDGKLDEGFFIGYSLNSDGPKWLFDINVLTKSINYVSIVTGTNSNDLVDGLLFDSSLKNASNDEPQPSSDAEKKDDEGVNKESGIDDQERPKNSTQDVNTARPSINTSSINVNTVDMSNITTTYPVPFTPNTRIHKDHSLDHVIGDVQSGVLTKRMTKTTNEQGFIRRAQKGTPSIKRSKLDRSYARRASVVQVISGLDLGGFAIWKKSHWLFLAYASFKDFIVYQMDVKCAFLYGKIEEEVYVCQPPGFEDPEFSNRVYKVEKALYGLHQAPRAWYETLSTYLLDNGFQRGQIDKTLFIKRVKSDILLVQVYVDDIIFGSTKKKLCTEFEKLMHKKFQMSSMGELTFFLGLQVTQKDNEIFISQDKYVDKILKKFIFSTMKKASTPMETSKPLMKDENAEDVDVYLYRSMIGSLMYLTSSRYSNEKKLIQIIKIHTDQNVADLLTKAFDVGRFQYLIATANDEIQVSVVGLTYY
ncbi:putative ribonuclease H-like domain-containing protein, partial [Tanacetum coccineum]